MQSRQNLLTAPRWFQLLIIGMVLFMTITDVILGVAIYRTNENAWWAVLALPVFQYFIVKSCLPGERG